jgi:hypothetical protein
MLDAHAQLLRATAAFVLFSRSSSGLDLMLLQVKVAAETMFIVCC